MSFYRFVFIRRACVSGIVPFPRLLAFQEGGMWAGIVGSKVNIVYFSIKIELSKIMKPSDSMFSKYNTCIPKR